MTNTDYSLKLKVNNQRNNKIRQLEQEAQLGKRIRAIRPFMSCEVIRCVNQRGIYDFLSVLNSN